MNYAETKSDNQMSKGRSRRMGRTRLKRPIRRPCSCRYFWIFDLDLDLSF